MVRLAVVLSAVLLSACADDLARNEGVTAFAGNAQAEAIAGQAVNPWPKKAYDKTFPGNGDRAVAAWKRLLLGDAATAATAASDGASATAAGS